MIKSLRNIINNFRKSKNIFTLNDDNFGVYFINDPDSPDLIEEQKHYPNVSNLSFYVAGYNHLHCNKKENHAISQAINCHMTLAKSIEYFNSTYTKFHSLVPKWATTRRLTVLPRAGKDFNAFYDRSSLKFFSDEHPRTKKTVYSVDSADIVSHECGHGILDSIRPDFWNMQTKEVWALHEAFGDVQAVVTTSQSEKIVKKALEQTNGNLRLSNSISRIAEQLGGAIYLNRNPAYLRDLSIVFKYQKPSTLPDEASSDQLSSECHSFSRVFSGAWYICLVEVFEVLRKEKDDFKAWSEARDICYFYLLKAIKNVPNTPNLFDAVAKLILLADKENGNKYQEVLKNIFIERKILINRIKMLNNKNINDIKNKISSNKISSKNFMIVRKTNDFSYASIVKKNYCKLSDHLISIQSNSHPIYNAEIEVANDSLYIFDKEENLIDEIVEDENEIIDAAFDCTTSIINQNLLDKIWKIENNKLIRNCVDCGIH